MTVLSVYTRLYAGCMKQALQSIAKSPWTLLLPMAMGLLLQIATAIAMGMGFLGGILLALAIDALISSYLYFVSELVSKNRVSVNEFGRSVRAYFWSVLNLMFVFWIVGFLLRAMLGGTAQGGVIMLALTLSAFIALNAAPEVIYEGRTYGGLQTIQGAWTFLKESWIEWFVPNIPLLVGVAAAAALPLLLGGRLGAVLSSMLGGAALHVVMVFRGFLFKELAGSNHRQRMFRYRNA